MELPFNVSETGYCFWGVTDALNLSGPHVSRPSALILCVGGSNGETKASVRRQNLLLIVNGNVGDDYTPLSHLWQPLSSDCWLSDIVTYSHSSSDGLFSILSFSISAVCLGTWCQRVRYERWHSQLLTHCNSRITVFRVTGSLPDLTDIFHTTLHRVVILHTVVTSGIWLICLLFLHKEGDDKKTKGKQSYYRSTWGVTCGIQRLTG